MTSATPPPGWYPEPSGTGGQRYWDGVRWIEEHAPAAVAQGPSQPARRPSSRKKILIVLGVLVLLGGGAVVILMNKVTEGYDVGGCVFFKRPSDPTDFDQSAKPHDARCDSDLATFTIVHKTSGNFVCKEELATYQWIRRSERRDDTVQSTWCLMPEIKQDRCYVVDGVSDEAECSEFEPDVAVLTYRAPGRTYCLVTP